MICLPSTSLPICTSVPLSRCLPTPPFSLYKSRLSVCPSVRLSVCPSVRLSDRLSVFLSICLFPCLTKPLETRKQIFSGLLFLVRSTTNSLFPRGYSSARLSFCLLFCLCSVYATSFSDFTNFHISTTFSVLCLPLRDYVSWLAWIIIMR